MIRPDLVHPDVAAEELGVPKASLRASAERAGLLIRMGRAVRVDRNKYSELVEACLVQPQAPASTGVKTLAFGTSETQADQINRQAQGIAEKLKKRSRRTSPVVTQSLAPVIPLKSTLRSA